MASVTALPVALRQRLVEAHRRLRRLQILRGIGLILFIQALGVGAALLLDAWLDLPSVARLGLLLGWLAVGLVVYFVYGQKHSVMAAGRAGLASRPENRS